MSLTERNDLEMYFEWFLNELLDNGYIRGYDREAEKFPLFPNYKAKRLKYFKTKEPEQEEFNFMHARYYNYDYNVKWTEKAKNIFYQEVDFSNNQELQLFPYKDVYFVATWNHQERCAISYVDVKPPGNARFGSENDSFITFPLKQQILLWMHGVYINKVVPKPMQGAGKTISLFPNTFTPKRYLMTDGGGQARKINFNITFLKDYIAFRKQKIKDIEDDLKKIYSKEKPSGQTTLL